MRRQWLRPPKTLRVGIKCDVPESYETMCKRLLIMFCIFVNFQTFQPTLAAGRHPGALAGSAPSLAPFCRFFELQHVPGGLIAGSCRAAPRLTHQSGGKGPRVPSAVPKLDRLAPQETKMPDCNFRWPLPTALPVQYANMTIAKNSSNRHYKSPFLILPGYKCFRLHRHDGR